MLPEAFVPQLGIRQAQDKTMRRFSNAINAGHSTLLRDELKRRQSGKCALCGESFEEGGSVVHHLTYEWLCEYDDEHSVDIPKKRKGRVVFEKVGCPPCDWCKAEHPEHFELCVSGRRMVLVHSACHQKIHGDHPKPTNSGRKDDEIALALRSVLLDLRERAKSTKAFFALCEKSGIGYEIWAPKGKPTKRGSVKYWFKQMEGRRKTSGNTLLQEFGKICLDQYYRQGDDSTE